MIALKLLFQSLAGVGSVLVCAGGGYYVMKEGNEESFYLVSSDTTTTSTPSEDLWLAEKKITAGETATILTAQTTPAQTKTQQNYKCFSTETNNKEIDDSCYLYSLTATPTNTAIKISDIQTFISDTSKTSTVVKKTEAKTEIKTNKFFLLKADKKLHTDWTFDGTKTIKLVEKSATTAETNNTYATFKVHAKISSSEVEGKTAFAIVKNLKDANPAISITTSSTLTCKLSATETAEPCFITALNNPDPATDLEKINFSSISNPATQQAISITKDKYYLVQFQTPKIHSLTELADEVIIVVSPTTSGEGTSTTTELKIQTPAFIQPPTTGTITEAIIIK